MQFKFLLTAAFAVCALAKDPEVKAAGGNETVYPDMEELTKSNPVYKNKNINLVSRFWVSFKIWHNQLCWTSLGGERKHDAGECIRLEQRWVALSIQRRSNANCHIIKYDDDWCFGYSERIVNLHDCANIDHPWKSIKVQC